MIFANLTSFIDDLIGDLCRHLRLAHASELRDLCVLLEHHNRTGAAAIATPAAGDGEKANAATKVPLEVPDEADYVQHFNSLFQEYRLSRTRLRDAESAGAEATSISSLKLPSSAGLKRKLAAELGSSPPPRSGSSAVKAKAAKQEAAQAKAAASAARLAASREKNTAKQQANGLTPRKASFSSRRSPPAAIGSVATPPPQSATARLNGVGSSATSAAEIAVASPTVSSSDDSAAPSPADTLSAAPGAVAQSSKLSQPPMLGTSEAAAPSALTVTEANDQPLPDRQPLHPTLQQLAPNPLSITYASSLRPLPPDPFRRYTGCGMGGGSHHRVRKAQQLPPSKPGVPPPLGPAGAGQTDLWKWYVRSRASPGAGLVGKADKCLLTRDWRVAFAEQRFLRAMARIEKLKESGNWSFRQPKKQKGPAVRKAHWDHLLEEARWMQTDYREERRWKLAVAHQLAHACKAWVRAKSPGAKAALCIRTRKSASVESRDEQSAEVRVKSELVEDEGDTRMEFVAPSKPDNDGLPRFGDDRASEPAPQREAVVPIRETLLATANAAAPIDGESMQDENDPDADGDAEPDDDADGDADDGEVEAATMALTNATSQAGTEANEIPSKTVFVHEPRPEVVMPALADLPVGDPKEGPMHADDQAASAMRTVIQQDPTLLQTAQVSGERSKSSTDSGNLPTSVASSLRAPIFSMDIASTVISPSVLLETFDADAAAELLGMEISQLRALLDTKTAWTISALFPELPEYGPPSEPESGKSDKRWDEGSLNQLPRLTQVTRILDAKPVLVSTLEPGKNRAQGRWKEDSDWVLAAKLADPTQGAPKQENDPLLLPATTLFTRRSNKPGREAPTSAPNHVLQPSQPEIRAAQMFWSADEDAFLMKLFQQYGANWPLVSDIFNSTRLTVPTDRREPWDCYDRWDRITKAAAQGKPPPPIPQLPSTAPPTPADPAGTGAKEDSSAAASPVQAPTQPASMAAKREKLAKKLTTKFDGSRKKMRHSNILEVMRKTAKRREATAKPALGPGEVRKVNLASHETHNTPKGGQTPTPQQLSSLKADRDEAQMRQYYMFQQRRLEEQQRMAAAQVAAVQAQAQAQQQQQQQSSGQTQQIGQQQGNTNAVAQSGSSQTGHQQNALSPPQPQQQSQQQQPAQQVQHQQQQPPRGAPGNQPRPPLPTAHQGNRPNSAAGPRPGTPSQNTSQPQQQQNVPAGGGGGQQQPQLTQQQQGLAALQRMTPQQQAAFAAQIRHPLQSYSMAVSQSMANGMAMATSRSPMPGQGVQNHGGTNSPASNVTASPQLPNQSQIGQGGPSNGPVNNGAIGLGGLPAVTVQQIQATLQSTVAQNLSQEQIQHLALQLFRNAHQQHQAQQAALQQQQQQQQGQGQRQGVQQPGAQGGARRPPPMGVNGMNGTAASSPRPPAPVPQGMPMPPRPGGGPQSMPAQQQQQGQQGKRLSNAGAAK